MTDGMPTLIVEIGFTSPSTGTYLHLGDRMRGKLGTATLAPSTLLVDVSEYVMSVDMRVGATRADGPSLRYEAGTWTIVLDNRDRRFDPTNLAGPYVVSGVTQVEPMRVVRVRASYGGVTWPLVRGFADNWAVSYDGPNMARAVLTCSDAFMVFASYDRAAQAAVGAGEDAGARVGRILDSVSWPATDRVVDTGNTSLQSTTLANNVLTELLLTADSEMGELFVDAKGRVTFRRRSAVQDDTRSAYPQAHFGDLVDEAVDTTINLVTNPSSEVGITGWIGGGFANPPVLTLSGVRAMFGSSSVLATWATASGANLPLIQYSVTGLTAGRTYTISVYAYVPAGSPSVACVLATTGPWGTGTDGVTGQWVRLSLTTTVAAASVNFQVWPENSVTTAGQQVWLDGLQVEEGTTATVYCDGTQPGCEWDGPPHASTSRRLPELPYADVEIANDAQSIYNLFLIANAGGTQQLTERASSRTAYLTRSWQRSDLLLQTDASALTYGEVLRDRYSLPELRFASMELLPLRDPDRLWPAVLGRQLGDRVRVTRRPPGGGDPIVRDVLVRGISHTITADNWRTEWVFQSALPIVRVVDTFSRTEVTGWGITDSGHTWVIDAGVAADFAVNGTQGVISLGAVNTHKAMAVNLDAPGQDVTLWCTLPVTPTGAGINWGALLRRRDASNYYWIDVQVGTDSTLTLRLIKREAGVFTQLTTAATGVTHSTTVPRILRTRAVGSKIEAKVWSSSGSEPAGWQLSTTDGTFGQDSAVGVIARLMTGNTNALPVAVQFNDFSATSQHVWT